MTIQEIMLLASKDLVVQQHQFLVLKWTKVAWVNAVAAKLEALRGLTVGEQSIIRMRYLAKWKS